MPGFIQHTILKTSAGKIIEKTTFRRSHIVNFLHTDPVFPDPIFPAPEALWPSMSGDSLQSRNKGRGIGGVDAQPVRGDDQRDVRLATGINEQTQIAARLIAHLMVQKPRRDEAQICGRGLTSLLPGNGLQEIRLRVLRRCLWQSRDAHERFAMALVGDAPAALGKFFDLLGARGEMNVFPADRAEFLYGLITTVKVFPLQRAPLDGTAFDVNQVEVHGDELYSLTRPGGKPCFVFVNELPKVRC